MAASSALPVAIGFDHLRYVAWASPWWCWLLESARTRSEELNDKMRRLTLLTAASTQTLSVRRRAGAGAGSPGGEPRCNARNCAHLLEGEGRRGPVGCRASVGFQQAYLTAIRAHRIGFEPWVQRVLQKDCLFLRD